MDASNDVKSPLVPGLGCIRDLRAGLLLEQSYQTSPLSSQKGVILYLVVDFNLTIKQYRDYTVKASYNEMERKQRLPTGFFYPVASAAVVIFFYLIRYR